MRCYNHCNQTVPLVDNNQWPTRNLSYSIPLVPPKSMLAIGTQCCRHLHIITWIMGCSPYMNGRCYTLATEVTANGFAKAKLRRCQAWNTNNTAAWNQSQGANSSLTSSTEALIQQLIAAKESKWSSVEAEYKSADAKWQACKRHEKHIPVIDSAPWKHCVLI